MRVENVKGAVWTVDEIEFYKRRPQKMSGFVVVTFRFSLSLIFYLFFPFPGIFLCISIYFFLSVSVVYFSSYTFWCCVPRLFFTVLPTKCVRTQKSVEMSNLTSPDKVLYVHAKMVRQ